MNHLSLFSGVGGGDLAHQHLLGWQTVGYVEWDEYCQQVLAQRIKDGFLDEAPIYGDIDGFLESGAAKKYQGFIDVVTAGFPCQPFSVAGKQAGEEDPRNKWPQTIQCLRDLGCRWALLENVPGLLNSGYFPEILRSLAEAGFDARWIVLGADDVGAPHRRKRLWILADADSDDWWPRSGTVAQGRGSRLEHRSGSAGQSVRRSGEDVADSECLRQQGSRKLVRPGYQEADSQRQADHAVNGSEGAERSWPPEPQLGRVVDGVANRVDRLKAIGNGQVSRVAATAWDILSGVIPTYETVALVMEKGVLSNGEG